MEQIKPGTRCECLDCNCFEWHKDVDEPTAERCPRDAVRMVTVRDSAGNVRPDCVAVTGADHVTGIVGIPMCEACAQFHEVKHASIS